MPNPITPEMREALAEVVNDAECGVLSWHDIGEHACSSLPQLRALLDALPTVEDSLTVATPDNAWDAEIERLKREAVKLERCALMVSDCLHGQILAMRAAVAESVNNGPARGMEWIYNTLAGPGNLPTNDECAMGAQQLFDKETAEHQAFRAANPPPAGRAMGGDP